MDSSAIRALLDRLREQEQCELVNGGYAVNDAAVRTSALQVVAVQAEPMLPYPRYALA